MASLHQLAQRSTCSPFTRSVQPLLQSYFTAPRRRHQNLCFVVHAEPENKQSPQTTKVQNEDLPPWVRREKEREFQAKEAEGKGLQLPWPLALLFSVFTIIAATGSIFEYVDKNALFGVIQPDSPLWQPIVLFLAVTGYPTGAYLFKYGVDRFNEAAERQDRLDGYLPKDRE